MGRLAGLILLALTIPIPLAAKERKPALADLDVLVISPKGMRESTAWIATLLTGHGAKASHVDWKTATRERARKFDLVVVAGKGRNLGKNVVTDYDRPVLGVGNYGHHYFGRTRLKHGHPYS